MSLDLDTPAGLGQRSPRPRPDRVLVLVPPGSGAEAVLDQARRIADALQAPLLAVHVEQPGQDGDAGPGLALAQKLGADTEVITAHDLPHAILSHATAKEATHIVIGRGTPPWWRRWAGRTLVAAMGRRATAFTLHVVPDARPAPRAAPVPSAAPGWALWLLVPIFVGLATLLCLVLDGEVPDAAFGMVYLTAVVAIAATAGALHAGVGAVLSFLAWNFLFLPPRYTLTIESAQDVLGVLVFGVVAALLAGITSRLGRNVRAAAARLAALRRLTALSRRLSAQSTPAELRDVVVEEAARIAAAPACLLLPPEERLAADRRHDPELRAASPADAIPDEAAMAAARWTLGNGQAAGRGTAMLPGSSWRFLPLRASRRGSEGEAREVVIGLLGLRADPDAEADRALEALLDQASVAMERARLAEAAARAQLRGEAEALRTALLTSLGHDMRTPLTAIRGAAETLRISGPALEEPVRADLLATIEEEATRLARWMSAILDIVRLETGQLAPRRAPVDLAGAAAEWVGGMAEAARIHASIAPGLPQPQLDATLLDRVLENLLDNALKYSTGEVRLAAGQEGGDIVITVEDDGPGIAAADLPQVFDPFFRARRTDRVTAGSGLGLSICRGLVGAMGGRIGAESPLRQGQGTRVTVRFPA